MANYIPVIGLEIHAQINTLSKMFCACDNNSFNEAPNSNVCPICMGFPGVLPVINFTAIEKAIAASLALNLTVHEFSRFDRKNYFYPDLPKGYQISQYEKPLATKGYLEIEVASKKKKIGITRLHLEEDAGKLMHVAGGTLCDFNRCGTPLMEIVSEPELSSPEEAVIYAEEIQKIIRAISASAADMEKGMLRFDINVSLKESVNSPFGTKVEVKNLNSFRALEKALEYEIKRQSESIDKNIPIIQETRGFDSEKEITVSQRSKESAHDYRYFPEPDLPPVEITKTQIEKIAAHLPELPQAKKVRYQKEFKLQSHDIDILIANPDLAAFFEALVMRTNLPEKAITWTTNVILNNLNLEKISITESHLTPDLIARLIQAIEKEEISGITAKEEVFPEIWRTGKDPDAIINEKNLRQLSDTTLLESIVTKVIAANPDSVADLHSGKEKALGFLIGQAMKESRGQGNPKLFQTLFRKNLLNS